MGSLRSVLVLALLGMALAARQEVPDAQLRGLLLEVGVKLFVGVGLGLRVRQGGGRGRGGAAGPGGRLHPGGW